MKHITISEFGRIQRTNLPVTCMKRLQALDEGLAPKFGNSIFDWSRRAEIRAKNYVGVVQVPGLCIEILPKIDTSQTGEVNPKRAQANLLYMLAYAGKIPFQERDLATLGRRHHPLIEVLIGIFAESLIREIRKGVHHAYIDQEENLPYIRGRLVFSEHMRRNAAHLERLFVGFDEFQPDTWLNRVLKATCRRLLHLTRMYRTEQCLREVILFFEGVRDLRIRPHHFDLIQLDRNSERFRTLLDFAKLVLCEAAPTPEVGRIQTFNLLFPMETVFEGFVGEYIRRNSADFGLSRGSVHLQARGARRWLVCDAGGMGRFRLRPDILVGAKSDVRMILDTKWKQLVPDALDASNRVSQADVYQLFAYAKRYSCPDNVLVYPMVPGVKAKEYKLDGDAEGGCLRIECLDVSRDLMRESMGLKEDMAGILRSSRRGDGAYRHVVGL